MKTVRLSLIILAFTFLLILPNTIAQDYTTWSLPDGAMARLGKGEITGNIVSLQMVIGLQLPVLSVYGFTMCVQEKKRKKMPESGVTKVQFSPNGALIATGFRDGTLHIFSRHTEEHLGGYKGHTEGISALTFSPDSRAIASGSDDGTILIWELR